MKDARKRTRVRARSRSKSRRQRGGGGQVFIAYHIYCNQHTRPIMLNQCMHILFSGLYNRVDEIRCYVTGEPLHITDIKETLDKLGKKFKVAGEKANDKSYERFTLGEIRKTVQDNDKFLYMHTKGITRPAELNVFWWRTWMEWYLIKNFDKCIAELDNVDIVGVGHRTKSELPVGPHFSGNFWWARGDYFKRLPEQIGFNYVDPEMYIFRGNPRFKDMDAQRRPDTPFGSNFYHNPVLPLEYVDVPKE